jgi:5-methylcytosine-specific restriction endonuclease McrA
MSIPDHKVCAACLEPKPRTEFGRRALASDGLHARCRICLRDYNRAWKSKNRIGPDPIRRAQDHARYASNPDRFKQRARVNLHRRRAVEGEFTPEEWLALCEKYGNRCLACGRGDLPLTVDHVIPISAGGTNWITDVQPLCGPCNSKKQQKIIDYRPMEQAPLP